MSGSTPTLAFEKFVFTPEDATVLPTVVKCYWPASPSRARSHASGSGVTIICLHATSMHKESWEPVIEDLYRLQDQGGVRIRDVWSIDHPHHGEAAVMNESALPASWVDGQSVFSWTNSARTVHALLAGLGKGVPVNFMERQLVLLGHSLGAGVLSIVTTMSPTLPVMRAILIEPCSEKVRSCMTDIADKVPSQTESWASKNDARNALRGKGVWKKFDERAFEVFLSHGLRVLPSSRRPGEEGVATSCPKDHETAMYIDFEGHDAVFQSLPGLSKRTTLHLVFGTQHHPMMMSYESKRRIISQANPASVSWIEGPHLLPQIAPTAVAQEVNELLQSQAAPPTITDVNVELPRPRL